MFAELFFVCFSLHASKYIHTNGAHYKLKENEVMETSLTLRHNAIALYFLAIRNAAAC